MIRNLLADKDSKERARIKAEEISKLECRGEYVSQEFGLRIEIQSLSEIPGGGIEVLVRGWEQGRALGFGIDGSVEIERIRIFNPPILVEDPAGDVMKIHTDPAGNVRTKRLKEDPLAAIRQSLAHTIHLIGVRSAKITKGKIGNTTTTVYPDANPESTSVDGWVTNGGTNLSWATIHDAATGSSADDSSVGNNPVVIQAGTTAWNDLRRGFYLFDTSTIPDTDVISAATLSFHGGSNGTSNAFSMTVNVYASTPASNTSLATADFDQVGSTAFCDTAISVPSWQDAAYNDYALNASGLAAISKTGVSKFSLRATQDATNTEPAHSASAIAYIGVDHAENAGTSQDPKLVITHAAPAAGNSNLTLLGVG